MLRGRAAHMKPSFPLYRYTVFRYTGIQFSVIQVYRFNPEISISTFNAALSISNSSNLVCSLKLLAQSIVTVRGRCCVR